MYTGQAPTYYAQTDKPHDLAGLKASYRNAIELGEWVSVYVAAEQFIDTDDDTPYVALCESHGSIVEVATIADAKICARDPLSFCDDCRAIAAKGYREYHEERLAEEREFAQRVEARKRQTAQQESA